MVHMVVFLAKQKVSVGFSAAPNVQSTRNTFSKIGDLQAPIILK